MIQQTIIQHTQTPHGFMEDMAKELFNNHLLPYLQNLHKPIPESRYFSRQETAKILGIALSILSDSTKTGAIITSRFGGRVLYRVMRHSERINQNTNRIEV